MSGRFGALLLKRLLLGVLTLWLLSIVVFLGTQVLPGDPGRAILGPLAHLVTPQWSVLAGGLAGGTLAWLIVRGMRRHG